MGDYAMPWHRVPGQATGRGWRAGACRHGGCLL